MSDGEDLKGRGLQVAIGEAKRAPISDYSSFPIIKQFQDCPVRRIPDYV